MVQMRAVYSALGLGVFILVCIALVEGQNSDDCECVPLHLCKNEAITAIPQINTTTIPRPNTTANRWRIDLRSLTCASPLQTCCKSQNQIPSEEFSTPAALPASYMCGLRNLGGFEYAIEGAQHGEADVGEFPWMVTLLHQKPKSGGAQGVDLTYECAGALIHPQVVLTAAHCLESSISDYVIRAGEWDSKTTDELLVHQDRSISEVIVHEQYDNDTMFNDIALVILQQPFTLEQHINVVCLPDQGANFDLARCFTGGWGRKNWDDLNSFSVILKKIELPVMPQPKCLTALREERLGPRFELHDSFICAGGELGVDVCEGDGGSPLVCPLVGEPNYYQQAGIVSWGLGCGEAGVPGVYVNVAHFRDWIDQKMTSKTFGTSSYTYNDWSA